MGADGAHRNPASGPNIQRNRQQKRSSHQRDRTSVVGLAEYDTPDALLVPPPSLASSAGQHLSMRLHRGMGFTLDVLRSTYGETVVNGADARGVVVGSLTSPDEPRQPTQAPFTTPNGGYSSGEKNKYKTKKKRTEATEEKYPYGNYPGYYGYRHQGANANASTSAGGYLGHILRHLSYEDPRIRVMEKNWFVGRPLLDVGCHEGILSLSMAMRFGTSELMGVDIDPKLITRAKKRLKNLRRSLRFESDGHTDTNGAGFATRTNRGSEGKDEEDRIEEIGGGDEGDGATNDTDINEEPPPSTPPPAAQERLRAIRSVRFISGNFLDLEGVPKAHFGVVTCLSTTKWVHINFGDQALITFIQKLCCCVAPGGRLILEPQPWKSYARVKEKKTTKHPSTAAKLNGLKIRPDDLPSLIVRETGFVLEHTVTPGDQALGFGRDILIFRRVVGEGTTGSRDQCKLERGEVGEPV